MGSAVKRAVVVVLLAFLGVAACGYRISPVGKPGPRFVTMNTVHKTRILIENWKVAFERYPPSVLTAPPAFDEKPDTGNGVCEGIEAVYQALLWPGFKADPDWEAAQLANVDQDTASVPLNRTGHRDLMELVDAWGNPLVYFHHDDYRRCAKMGATYLTGDGSSVSPRPYTTASGEFVNPDSFQLYSMGPDSKPNTTDDIVSWGR